MVTPLIAAANVELWGAALGVVVSIFGIAGILIKTWLIPYLKVEVFDPLQEAHHQLTVNHHSSDRPTVLDLIADLKMGLADAAVDRAEIKGEVLTIRHTQDRVGTELKDHLEQAATERENIEKERIAMWSAIEAVAKSQPVETPIPVTVVPPDAGKGTE